MKTYVLPLRWYGLVMCGLVAFLWWAFFDFSSLMAPVWWQQLTWSVNLALPWTWLRSSWALVSSTCSELFFCKHPCSVWSTWLDCLDYCAAGQALWAWCTGWNLLTGVCVGVCGSSYQSGATWTTCTQQPTDLLSCGAGEYCRWVTPVQTTSWAVCQEQCGSLHTTTWTSATVLTWTTPWLCASGASLVSWSIVSYTSRWMRSCTGLGTGTGVCSLWKILVSGTGTVSTGSLPARWGKPSTILSWVLLMPKKHPVDPYAPKGPKKSVSERLSERLRDSLEMFDEVCAWSESYRETFFKDLARNPDDEAIRTLQAYCIVNGYRYSHNQKYHAQAATSIGEAIKVLTKIAVLRKWVFFDEFGRYAGRLPYSDMMPNAWYTPYVIYADEHGYLEGVTSWKMFGRGELKALTPISKKQFATLLENYWKDVTSYEYFSKPWKYVLRDDMAKIVVDAFADELADYRHLYGNNTLFYRRLLPRLEESTHQESYVNSLIGILEKRDDELMWRKYNLDLQGIIAFLHSLSDS